ncbi:hypothetical protein FRC03_007518 [Tulasnella sp. 419]|nr:hypothetical protein FRC03_007518 [Tulasnella sp. 419]
MHPFKSDLLQSTRRDQKALSLLNEEIRRQENRQMAVASTGSTAKLRIRICRESMDAPKEMDLGLFDTSTRLDIVLWKTTTPTDSKGPHISLKEHPNFYAKQAKKHKHTKDGVLFERLTPERSIESLPSEDGTRVVHLVTSKYPYILAARGHSPRSLGQQSSHGLLSKDFGSLKTDAFRALNDQLLKHITYEIRNVSSDLVVNQENSQSLLQKDIPPDTLRFYKSDWLIVLDQTSPDPEEKRPTQLMVPSQVPGELGGTSRPAISRSTTPTPSRPATPPATPASAPQNRVEQQLETRKEKKKGFRSFFGWG